MTTPTEPDLYDVEAALRHMAMCRLLPNELTLAEAKIGDDLAAAIARHFADPAEREIAGKALVLVAASIGVLTAERSLPPTTVPSIVGFAGSRLVVDVRNEEATHG